MKLLSVNVGKPRSVAHNGKRVRTGIFKSAVEGRVMVNELNLEGDRQADLRVHGGWSKAVYAYPYEHYDFWRAQLPALDYPFGIFGENLTTTGILEDEICVGDKLEIGSARFIVTEPRFPCYKLGIRFGFPEMVIHFHLSGHYGFYLAVEKQGEIEASNPVEIVHRDPRRVSIADIIRLKNDLSKDKDLIRRALEVEALPEGLKRRLRGKLKNIE
ncbi:MAG: MOSC domain-containing protein [Acidobacteriota bacterium]|nr:MOSC domain-containing protein [Acidobacteriota bacterium]